MRFSKVGVATVLLVSLFLTGCFNPNNAGPPTGDDIWEKVVYIGSLGFIGDDSNALVAITRILIFILVFALFQTAAKAVPGLNQSRNTGIAVSIILAIISTIFIPESILIAIGSAYSTLLAILIVGTPVAGGLFVHRLFSGEGFGNKIGRFGTLVVLSLYLVTALNAASEYNGPLDNLAAGVLNFVWWALIIIFILLVWELLHSLEILGVGKGISGFGKGVGKKIQDYNPWSKRRARRLQKREINEYILEEKEENTLHDLKNSAVDIVANLEKAVNDGEFDVKEHLKIKKEIEDFGEKINEAKRLFTQLSKRTSRTDSELTKFDKLLNNTYDYYKKQGVRIPEEVKALERIILKLHQQIAQEIAGVDGLYKKIINDEAWVILNNRMDKELFGDNGHYSLETDSNPLNLGHVHALIKDFQDERFLLEDAFNREAEAKQKLIRFMKETRDLYQ